MKLQIGDTVRYLNDVGGGKVQRIISNTMVEIIDDSGFEIPVLENELIRIEGANNSVASEIELHNNPAKEIEIQEDTNIEIDGNNTPQFYLGFTVSKKKQNVFDMFLINDCNYITSFVLSKQQENASKIIEIGTLDSNTKLFISEISQEQIANISSFSIQFLLYKKTDFEIQKPIDTKYVVHGTKFYKSGVFTENDFFEENAYVINLLHEQFKNHIESIDKIDLSKEIFAKKQGERKRIFTTETAAKEVEKLKEIDLHIHEIVENEQGLDAAAKLDIQLKTFEKELSNSLKTNTEKIVFIHGVGNGVLKAKIRGILDRDYSHLFYQDASFQKYKFGATLVYLKKIKK